MGSSFFNDLPIFGRRPLNDDPQYVRKPADRKARREKGVAGSYKHVVTNHGNLVSNETFVGMIENLGDAYEMTEEMYGMIWWLAGTMPSENADQIKERVEAARQNYDDGLKIAKQVNRREQ